MNEPELKHTYTHPKAIQGANQSSPITNQVNRDQVAQNQGQTYSKFRHQAVSLNKTSENPDLTLESKNNWQAPEPDTNIIFSIISHLKHRIL